MTTNARIPSSWATFELVDQSRAVVNSTVKVPQHWNKTSTPAITPTSQKNIAPKTKE